MGFSLPSCFQNHKESGPLRGRRSIRRRNATVGGLGALAVLGCAAAWALGGVGSADAAADPPQAKPAGLLEKIEPVRMGRTTTKPTLQCPSTPPDTCRDYTRFYDAGIVEDRHLDDLWTVPGDIVDFHAAYIACLPTNAPPGTSDSGYQWTKTGFPNPGLTPDDHQPVWRFKNPDLPTFPLRNSTGHWSTNVPMTSDWTIDSVTRQMHNEQVVSVAPLAVETSQCGTREQRYSVSGNSPSIYLAVFDPEITLKKYVCLPGKDCSDTDLETSDAWADAGTADGVPTGDKVPGPYLDGQSVTWLIDVTNTGTVDLENVRIPGDDAAEMGDQLSGVMSGHDTSCEGLIAEELPVGESAQLTCTTKLHVEGNKGGTLRNDAQALAEAVPSEAAAERVGEEPRTVRSNADPAVANVLVPKLKLIKQVCIHANSSKCLQGDASAWVDATWPMDPYGQLVTDPADRPVAGKDYPVIPEGKDATWRITVINIGETDLANVELKTDDVSGGGKSALDSDCLAQDPGALLLKAGTGNGPGEAYSFTCTTESIKSAGGPTVNRAQATSTAVSVVEGEVIPYVNPDGSAVEVKSNVDTATIDAYHPELTLKKYACKKGVGCDPDNASDWLDSGGDPTLTEGDDGYEPYDPKDRVWVKAGEPIEWLIVAKNTGNVALSPVLLTKDQLSGATDGVATNGCAATADQPLQFPLTGDPAALLPGAATSLTCTTDPVTENSERASLTNTAQATGTSVDAEGKPLEDVPEATSNEDMANVAAAKPRLTLKKYACVSGTGCTLPESKEDAAAILANEDEEWSDAQDSAHSVIVGDGDDVEWLILVQNDGTVNLADVTLATDVVTADGKDDDKGAPGCQPGDPFTTLDVADGMLAPGGYSYLSCRTEVHASDSATGVVNNASATAQALNPDHPDGDVPLLADPSANTVTTEIDPAHAAAARPNIGLTKWVCEAGKVCEPEHYVSATEHGSWVKSTEIPAGTAANWLIVVTNTGNVDLSGVSLSSETLTAAGVAARASDGQTCATAFGTQSLAIGAHIAFPCVSEGVMLTESPLVNTATATGTDSFGTDVNSDPDSAQVTVPKPSPVPPGTPPGPGPSVGNPTPGTPSLPGTSGGPALMLVKQVCKWGTGCDVTRDADWVAVTTQPAGRTATWRIVVRNTGSETLRGVTVTDRLSKGRSGAEASCQMTTRPSDTLRPGYQVAYLCSSARVLKTESGLTNSASATATGLHSGSTVTTPTSSASVRIEGGSGGTLPFTGAGLGAAGLAIMLLAAGAITLWLRRGWHVAGARHVAR